MAGAAAVPTYLQPAVCCRSEQLVRTYCSVPQRGANAGSVVARISPETSPIAFVLSVGGECKGLEREAGSLFREVVGRFGHCMEVVFVFALPFRVSVNTSLITT